MHITRCVQAFAFLAFYKDDDRFEMSRGDGNEKEPSAMSRSVCAASGLGSRTALT